MEEQKRRIHIALEELLILIGLIGQLLTYTVGNFMQASILLFFTNLSNWFIILITLVMLLRELLVKDKPVPKWLATLQYMSVTSISLTFLVFTLVLAPEMFLAGNAGYLTSFSNLCVHIIVPILSVVIWFFFSEIYDIKLSMLLTSVIFPFCYLIFVFQWILFGGNFGPGAQVPYFFLDFEKNGWITIEKGRIGVIWWIVLLCIGMLFFSFMLLIGKKKLQGRKRNK